MRVCKNCGKEIEWVMTGRVKYCLMCKVEKQGGRKTRNEDRLKAKIKEMLTPKSNRYNIKEK